MWIAITAVAGLAVLAFGLWIAWEFAHPMECRCGAVCWCEPQDEEQVSLVVNRRDA